MYYCYCNSLEFGTGSDSSIDLSTEMWLTAEEAPTADLTGELMVMGIARLSTNCLVDKSPGSKIRSLKVSSNAQASPGPNEISGAQFGRLSSIITFIFVFKFVCETHGLHEGAHPPLSYFIGEQFATNVLKPTLHSLFLVARASG